MNTLIKKVEAKYIEEKTEVNVGDRIKAILKVIEGQKERLQTFEGVVIGIKGNGINKNITVRKISYGVGVERVIPLASRRLHSIEIVRKGKVRRSKLFYLRERVGKAALKVKNAD
jgi:large subunit ribosomal protein L19